MILSVSRRTDIPNYYSDWFFNRLREGFLYVRNPMNAHQVSRVELSPHLIDCIVFWTKNPLPMMGRLGELREYPYYIQFTLTGYGKDMEPGLPDKRRVLIPAFRELSAMLGKKRVVWRYDPILLSPAYTMEYHLKAFEEIACSLEGYTDKAVISFVDFYAKVRRNAAGLGIAGVPEGEMHRFAGKLSEAAGKYGMKVESCAEAADLSQAGIRHGSCMDKERIEEISGCRIVAGKDKNQRDGCGCIESIEVGTYHTCPSGCRYCYANVSEEKVRINRKLYDADAPMLCGSIGPDDKITDRKVRSLKDGQIGLFDM